MSITDPNNYPEKSGIDPRDENHPNFVKKMIKVQLPQLTQKIVNKDLWFETIFVIMIIFTWIGELFGRRFPFGWYLVLVIAISFLFYKSYKKLCQTKEKQNPQQNS